MGKSTPQPPAPPDPFRTAQAQTGSNVATGISNAWLGNANEVTPWGNVNYSPTSFNTVTEQGASDGRGGFLPSTSHQVPQFTRTVSLTPGAQNQFNQQQQLGTQLNQFAIDQTGRLQNTLGTPLSTSGMPEGGDISMGNRPNYHTTPVPTPGLQTSLGNTDFEQSRRDVENSLYSRLNPQLDRDREALENRLINQGAVMGSRAFDEGIDAANRQANDARQQVVLAGGQEQSRLFDIARQTGEFGNAAQQQMYANEMGSNQYANDLRQRAFGDQMNIAGRMDTQRDRALQEQLALRNQPINEIGALMSGGQVNMPQFTQYNPSQVQNTPVGSYVYNTAALNNQNFQQQQAQNNARMGGLFGLGSSAITGAMFSDRRLKEAIRDTGIRLLNGLKVYVFRYIGEARDRVGYMADEVNPAAVRYIGGFAAVDYGLATRP